MSYILDALKKSEKERQRGTVPDMLTAQDALAQETKKRSLWPYLLLVALLLNAGVLVWWLLTPWQSKKQNVVAQSPAGQQRGSNALELAKPAEHPANVVQQNQPVQAEADLQRKVSGKPTPSVETRGSHEISPVVPQQTLAISHVPSEPEPGNNGVAVVENKVYNLNELPLSIQQSLPAFTISVSVYSDDPTSRMVKINGQMLQEGQYLTAGLKLEEITRDGVIFSYQSYRFCAGLR